jgi:7-carboxy-7-deazaguanine synthase
MLRVCEMFVSIQGEGTRAGLPCAFVRLSGCNLRCTWCDTPYAQNEGREDDILAVDTVAEWVLKTGVRRICITGGEPLQQCTHSVQLCTQCCAAGLEVLVETNGSLDITPLPREAVRIMDVKLPSSGESRSLLLSNIPALTARDEVKFVVADRADFDAALAFVQEHALADGPALLFGAVQGRCAPADLADWLLASGLDARLQIQLHKIIWPDRDRGV